MCSTAPRANACRRCRWASLSPAWLVPLTARRVWAIARDDGELVAFDADWNETGRLSLGVGIDTLVLAPDAKTLLVGNSIGGQVHVVDAPSLALLNTIEGLASPKGIAVIA